MGFMIVVVRGGGEDRMVAYRVKAVIAARLTE